MTDLINSAVDCLFPLLGVFAIVWVVAVASRPPERSIKEIYLEPGRKFNNEGDLK